MTISIKDGLLYIEGKELWCKVNSISVSGEIVWDEETMLLESGKERTFNGYDPSEIEISAMLFEPSEMESVRYTNLKTISDAFKKLEDKSAALWSVEADVLRALNITEAYFVSMSYTDNQSSDSINITIKLREHEPVVKQVQEQAKVTSSVSQEPRVSGPVLTLVDQNLVKKTKKTMVEK